MILFVVLCITTLWLALWTYYSYSKSYNYWKNKAVPYEKPTPIVGSLGNIFLRKESLGDRLELIYSKFKTPYAGFYIMNEPALLINDPEMIRHILVKDFNIFDNRTTVSDPLIDPISANILFNAKSPHWNEIRKKVTPIFSSGKLKGMYGLIYENTNDLMDYLKENNGVIETRDIFAKFTTDVISSTCYGINAHSFKDPEAEFRKVSKRLFDWDSFEISASITCYFLAPRIVKLLKLRFLNKQCTDFLKKVFFSTLTERERTKAFRNDLIDVLIHVKNKDKPTDKIKMEGDVLLAQAIQFFVAGFETTSSTMSFALYELAMNQKVQRKVQDEIREVLGKHKELTPDALKDMKYLEMVITETLRKYPVLPFLDRRCNSNYKLPGTDLVIEKNTPVFISITGLQYDERYFPEPHKFIPERWTEPEKSFTYLPFGEGPRICIGARFGVMTVKIGLARILSQFNVDICDETPINIKFDPKGWLLSPIGGMPLKLTKTA